MPWEPGRPSPPPPPIEERTLWVLVKDARSARAAERAHPLGRELRCLMASELLWSRVFKPGAVPTLEDEAEDTRTALLARGWHEAS